MYRQKQNNFPQFDFRNSVAPSYSGFGEVDDDIIDIDSEPISNERIDKFGIVDEKKAEDVDNDYFINSPDVPFANSQNDHFPQVSPSTINPLKQNNNSFQVQGYPYYNQPVPMPVQYPVPPYMQYINPGLPAIYPIAPNVMPQQMQPPYVQGPVYPYGCFMPGVNYPYYPVMSTPMDANNKVLPPKLDFDSADAEHIEKRSVRPKHSKGHTGYAKHSSHLYDYETDLKNLLDYESENEDNISNHNPNTDVDKSEGKVDDFKQPSIHNGEEVNSRMDDLDLYTENQIEKSAPKIKDNKETEDDPPVDNISRKIVNDKTVKDKEAEEMFFKPKKPKVYRKLARRIIPKSEANKNLAMKELSKQIPTSEDIKNMTEIKDGISNYANDEMLPHKQRDFSESFYKNTKPSVSHEELISVSSFLKGSKRSKKSLDDKSNDDVLKNLMRSSSNSAIEPINPGPVAVKHQTKNISSKNSESLIFDLDKVASICGIPNNISFDFLRQSIDGTVSFFQDVNGKVYSVPTNQVS